MATTKRPRGRPAKPPDARALASTRGFRLYAADAERLQRLAVKHRKTESELIRWALERLEQSFDAEDGTDLLFCDCGKERCIGSCSGACDNDE